MRRKPQGGNNGVDTMRWKPQGWIPQGGNHGVDIISNQLSTNYVFLLINKISILKKYNIFFFILLQKKQLCMKPNGFLVIYSLEYLLWLSEN